MIYLVLSATGVHETNSIDNDEEDKKNNNKSKKSEKGGGNAPKIPVRSYFYQEKQLQLLLIYHFLLLSGVICLPFVFFLPAGTKYAILSLVVIAVVLAIATKIWWKKLTKPLQNLKKMGFFEVLLQLLVGTVPLISVILIKKSLRLMVFCYLIWIFIFITALCKLFFDLGGNYWVLLLGVIFFAHLVIPFNLQLATIPKIIYLIVSYLILVPIIWYFYYSLRNKDDRNPQLIYGTVIFCLISILLFIPMVIQIEYRRALPALGFIILFLLPIILHFYFREKPIDKS